VAQNGSRPDPDPTALLVRIQQRCADLAARLQVQQTAVTGIAGAPAAAVAVALAAEIVTIGTWGASSLNPVP
jgi:hypothetical protein